MKVPLDKMGYSMPIDRNDIFMLENSRNKFTPTSKKKIPEPVVPCEEMLERREK